MEESMVITKSGRKYKTIVTDIGSGKIARAALLGEKVDVVTAVVTDGGGRYFEPTGDMTELPGEVWRGPIAKKEISETSPNMIRVKIFLDGTVGGFTARGMGLLDSEGDLIAVCNMPDTEKAVIIDGITATLTLVMNIVVTNAEVLDFTVDPSVDKVSAEELEEAVRKSAGELREDIRENSEELKEIIREQRVEIMGEVGGMLSGAASAEELDLTIPAEGWAEGPADPEDPPGLYLDVPDERVRAELVPFLALLPASLGAARDCGLSTAVRTLDGALRLYAQRVPTADMAASLTLLRTSGGTLSGGGGGGTYTLPPATAERLGGVKIGPGVHVDPDGTISVDGASIVEAVAASDEDAERMLEGVFGPEEAAP